MNFRTDIQSALQSTDEETRQGALRKLRGRALPDVQELLFSAMGDDSWRVRKEAVDVFVSSAPGKQSIAELLELLRNEDNAGLRNSAAETVVRLGSRAAAPLVCLAGDEDPDVRKFVLDVMGSIGSSEFAPSFKSALSDRNVNVAAAAAEHLGNLGYNLAVTDLMDAIIANESAFFRFSALAALGKMTSHVRVPPEIIALAGQDILRKGVYDCLGGIGDETTAPILLNGFSSQQKSSRKAAIAAWYRVFLRSSVTSRKTMEDSMRSLPGNEIVPLLMDCFKDGESALAEAVVALLGIIGDIRGIPALLETFAGERHSGVALTSLKRFGAAGVDALVAMYPQMEDSSRSAVCTVLGEIGHHAGNAIIRNALHDKSSLVRKAAVSSAGKLGLSDCITDIAALLDDDDQDVRIAVTASLQVLALIDRNAIQELARQLTGSESSDQRRNAAILHAALGDGGSLSLLVKDRDAEVRKAAIDSIGKQHHFANFEILLAALADEDPDVRIAAVEALGRTGVPSVAGSLFSALCDEDIWVQCAALRSIAQIDRSSAFPAIRSVFSKADGLLMITCLELLETIGGQDAMDLVETALMAQDADIVEAAIAILARQGGEWIITHAERLLAHPRREVRSAWVKVISGLPPEKAKYFLMLGLNQEASDLVRADIASLLAEIA